MTRLVDVAHDVVSSLSARVEHHCDDPVPRAQNFDLGRYMGAWHVIAAIPLAPELGAHNPVESYRLAADGHIDTTYVFRKDGFAGPVQVKTMVSHVVPDTGDAEWKVQMIGPLGAQYVISFAEPDYSAAIVARDARDHVWILSRTPSITPQQLDAYNARIETMGYDMAQLVYFPQNGEVPTA